MAVLHSVIDMIGRTPILRCHQMEQAHALSARLLVKIESRNPGGSIKDRAALSMIRRAQEKGLLAPGATVIEPTSGNTGIGLAMLASSLDYQAVIVMPDTMSIERIRLMQAFGAKVVLSDGKLGMQGAIDRAKELAESIPGSFIPSQFDNPDNALAHYETTGPEIWEDCQGQVDALVCGVGTGGTVTGCARYLKEKNPELYVLGVEPEGSAVLSGGTAGPHPLQGIGAGFIPEVLDRSLLTEVLAVAGEDAMKTARELGKREGILCGISSGAALYAAICLAKREEMKDKTVVAILPDTGERYLSTELFAEET